MDNLRRRHQAQPRKQALDGFFTKPLAQNSQHRRPHHLGSPKRAVKQSSPIGLRSAQTAPLVGRRLDDFRRPEGLHAPVRQAFQSNLTQPRGARGGSSAAVAQSPTRHVGPAAINMDLPELKVSSHGFGRRRASTAVSATKRRRTKYQTIKTWSFRLTGAALVTLLVLGGALLSKGYFKLNKVFQGGSSAAALKSEVDPALLKGEGDGRVNILLLGNGGAQHDGGDLTDTIMIASIDPVNNQAVLLSVPRDLWVKMPNNYIASYQKLNAAYESGKYKYLGKQDLSNTNRKAIEAGFQGVDSVVESVIGIPIHYNAIVNFQAFKQAIDTVGGVTVNVPEQLYDPTMAWENNHNPVLAQAGTQNFDGTKALIYVRSRETSSDFARSERQRSVMLALREKVFNLGTISNPLKLSNLINAFGNNVQTDISLSDTSRLINIMKKISGSQIASASLADKDKPLVTTGTINGLSVVEPKAGLEDYSQIKDYVRSKLTDGYISRENANVTVLNGTDIAGLATQKAAELKSYGYTVGTVGTAPTQAYAQTQIFDVSAGSKKYTLNYLKKRFNTSTVSTTLPAGIVPGSASIVIILGENEATTTQN